MPRILDIGAFNAVREAGLAKLVPAVPRVAVGMGTCGRGNGAEGLYHAFAQAIENSGADLVLAPVGCFGACFQEPLVNVRLPGNPLVILHRVQANDANRLLACDCTIWAKCTSSRNFFATGGIRTAMIASQALEDANKWLIGQIPQMRAVMLRIS